MQVGQRRDNIGSCEEDGFIPSALYNQISTSVPIVSVGTLIVIDGSLLFLRRNNHPAKGQWWFPGAGYVKESPSKKPVQVNSGKKQP